MIIMKIQRGRSRIRTVISCIIALVCVCGIAYSGYRIIEWKLDSDKTYEQTKKIEDTASVKEVADSEETETIASNEPPDTPYWNYIKMNLLDVDFDELKKINNETSGWLNNSDNFTVRTANKGESALWQVFSVYKIPVTNDYIQTTFANNEEFGRFAEALRARSKYDFKTTVAPTDNILTLSTCFSSTERVVLHAKLIKRSPR